MLNLIRWLRQRVSARRWQRDFDAAPVEPLGVALVKNVRGNWYVVGIDENKKALVEFLQIAKKKLDKYLCPAADHYKIDEEIKKAGGPYAIV